MGRGSRTLLAALAWLPLSGSCACAGAEATPPDRVVELHEPLSATPEDQGLERVLGRVELGGAHIEGRRAGPVPLRPRRLHEGAEGPAPAPVVVAFEAAGVAGQGARLGLLAPRAAARQEVAHDMPGQPADPRSVWAEIELRPDGLQRFELPAPGPDWHADWALVVLEFEGGWRARAGARSEMLADQTRRAGGRVVLAMLPVERRPTRIAARALADAPTLDGRLDEAAWAGPGQALVQSRTGEPGAELDARLGGPTRVWFAWDAEFLYVAGQLPDRDLYAPHQQRDDPLYRDEAFEVFLAASGSGRNYLEHQVNARDVVFDARFERYREGDEGWNGDWRHAVALDGELERRGGDRGWSVELAFAWRDLCADTDLRCPPRAGQTLRVNVFRLDKPDREQQVALALSPTLEPDFHAWRNAAELVLLGPEDDPT